MKVRMVTGISGGRGDGSAWPGPGEVLEVDGDEGAALCAAGVAEPVAEEPPPAKPAAKPAAASASTGAAKSTA